MKVVLMGDPGVGINTTISQLVNGNLEEALVKRHEWHTFSLETETGKHELVITGLTLAGDDPRRADAVGEGDAFILMYSVTEIESFNNLKPVRDELLHSKNVQALPILLVGNKIDIEELRQVTTVDGSMLAESWNAPFIEVSAYNHDNVVHLFTQLIEAKEMLSKPRKESKKDDKAAKKCCTIL